jgi:hypothetical protein
MSLRIFLGAVALVLAACSGGGEDPPPLAVSIDGTWAMIPTPGGTQFSLDLVSQMGIDTPGILVVNGHGIYQDAIGPGGTVGTMTAHGAYQKTKLDLDLTYDTGSVATLTGTVQSTSTMQAILQRADGSRQEIVLTRR